MGQRFQRLSLGSGLALALALSLVACGGSGGDAPGGEPAGGNKDPTSAQLAQICAKDNPFLGSASVPTREGSVEDEKRWIRAYMNERYLWYRDIPLLDLTATRYNQVAASGQPLVVQSLVNLFQDSKTSKLTVSGSKVDKFSFMIDTYSWNNFSAGQDLGYGWMLKTVGTGASTRVQVAYVYPSTRQGLAFAQGVMRGDEILSVDGYSPADADPSRFYAALSPAQSGSHDFVFLRQGMQIRRTLQALEAELPQAEHRMVNVNGVRWGYLMFNSHVQSAEPALVQAMADFRAQGIDELVVDLRYNGGGYLAIASALARAVAGPARTDNQIFEMTRFNDKRSAENFAMGFYATTLFTGQVYPTLDLARIYVLTSDETCSASESFINGLRGVDVQVIQVGTTTCGKPYGFYPQDNCGITYAAMEFEGVNAKGQGGFSDGLQPVCVARENLTYPLADARESLFASAIAHRAGLACSSPNGLRMLGASGPGTAAGWPTEKLLRRGEWQRNKFVSSGR